jgi:predicted dehydrogenase
VGGAAAGTPGRHDHLVSVRWGVVGPGRIAAKVVRDVPLVPGAEVVAVASRSPERAAAFAAEHGIARSHGSYRAIVDDDGVDVLYIATPHPQHRAVALAALRAGKAVLVEKAFTVTPAATREIADLARERGVFAMEAMWTRFQPAVVRMRELLADGAIGEATAVQADLGVQHPMSPDDRFATLELGGGALFDLAVYPISFAQMVLGTPETVTAHGVLNDAGVDIEEAVLLAYPDGRSASLFASLRCATPGEARVVGTGGWIHVLPRFHHPDVIVLHRFGRAPEEITAPHTGGGYAHELAEVVSCIAEGRTESTVMPLADTVAVQDVMGAVADALGMVPAEGPAELS